MALNKSKHILEGTLGKDPELRFGATGTAICKVSIATTHWDSKSKENITDWFDVTIFGKQAQYITDYAKKGEEICVEGTIIKEQYIDKDGQKRTVTKTICYEAQLPRREKDKNESYEGGYQPQQQQPRSNRNQYAQQSGGTTRPASDFSDMDDDIPF